MSDIDQQRRRFLRTAATLATSAGVASLNIEPVEAAKSPNEKLNLGCIGVAAQGEYNLNNVATENIVALCDIDAQRLQAAAERFPKAAKYEDYRKLLDREDLDAIVVATPDHTHAIPTVRALQKGLDVYCEKPLAHTVYEVRKIREWAKKQNAVTQMGTQIHAGNNYRRVVELIQSGAIGAVHRVHVWMSNTVQPGKRSKTSRHPDHINYDLWIGPAPMRKFDPSHFHFRWRSWWDFGGGTLADFGCHYMDLPFWALNLRHPISVEAIGSKTYQGDNETPNNMRVDYRFPAGKLNPPVHMTWYHGDLRPVWTKELKKGSGVLFEGERGRLLADYGSNRIMMGNDEDVVVPKPTIPNSIGHHQEWIKACKSRSETTCNFDYSGALAESVLLGNVAYRAGQRFINWDGANLRSSNCPEANHLIHKEYRKGWQLEG